jgi:hypothetical protein
VTLDWHCFQQLAKLAAKLPIRAGRYAAPTFGEMAGYSSGVALLPWAWNSGRSPA